MENIVYYWTWKLNMEKLFKIDFLENKEINSNASFHVPEDFQFNFFDDHWAYNFFLPESQCIFISQICFSSVFL